MKRIHGALPALALALACTEYPTQEPPAEGCAAGGEEIVHDGARYCVYERGITETGFRCEGELPVPYATDEFLVCAADEGLPGQVIDEVGQLAGFDGVMDGGGGTGGGGAGGGGGTCDPAACLASGGSCEGGACVSRLPGGPGNDCDRAAIAPPRLAGGPVIWGAMQTDMHPSMMDVGTVRHDPSDPCYKDPANCTNNGNVCAWEFSYFDVEGDVSTDDTAGTYRHTFWIDQEGGQHPTFSLIHSTASTYRFSLCFDEVFQDVSGAVQIEDEAGNDSNALCFEGVAY